MTGVLIHFYETTMTRHGYIQAGSQVTLPAAEAAEWVERGCATLIESKWQRDDAVEFTETKRQRSNGRKMAERAEE